MRTPGITTASKRAAYRALSKAGYELKRSHDPAAGLVRHLGPDMVMDIGANKGQFGSRLRGAGYSASMLSCEPLSEAFSVLGERVSGDARWDALNVAVGAEAGAMDINVAGNSVSSSLLPMNGRHLEVAPSSAYMRTEQVQVTTVDALVAEHDIDPARAVLKADVQGYEAMVLDGAQATLGDFAGVILELSLVPLYDGQALLPELLQRMERSGFVLWYLEPAYVDPSEGRLLWCDGGFVRANG